MAKTKESTAQEETTATEVVADTAQAKESAEAAIETATAPAKAKTTSKAATQKSDAPEQKGTYIYVGPTLPDGSLRKNQTLRGTRDAVLACLAPQIATYPQVQRLIVPVSGLAKEKRRIEAGDNAAAQAYGALSAATMNTQKEEN